jgi:decaprenyl-phosphate phosphoribosyltransferase
MPPSEARETTTPRTPAASQLAAAIALMRPSQWVKNGFVIAPLFFSGKLSPSLIVDCLFGALAFCLLSSAVYIFNDLYDLEDDKHHVKKRVRPLPSGRITVGTAVALGAALFIASIAVVAASGLPSRLYLVGMIYTGINLAYSLGLKHVAVLELFMVSSGYILRLLAGGIIDGEALSPWILVCTGLVSLMLAVGKRRGDIANEMDVAGRRGSLKHYTVPYLDQLTTLLAGTTFVTYLLFCLSDYGMARFGSDVMITAPFVLFGIFRFLQIVSAQNGGDSPTDMILRDAPLRTTIVLWLAAFFVIIHVLR